MHKILKEIVFGKTVGPTMEKEAHIHKQLGCEAFNVKDSIPSLF